MKQIQVAIIDYPDAMQSAVQGFNELLTLANMITDEHQLETCFSIQTLQSSVLQQLSEQALTRHSQTYDILIIPPSLNGEYYLAPNQQLIELILQAHKSGAVICSACAGTFILARTGLLNQRPATTHWKLAETFQEQFPQVNMEIERLLINDGELITAGGLMSWTDLGLELVAQFTKPHIMRTLGKYLIVDTGKREQRYYGSFNPKYNHGNSVISAVQHFIQGHYGTPLNIAKLAEIACMSERTFLRQFSASTGFKPNQYIQRLRVQKACDLLEASSQSFEQIAAQVGYEDVNSLRKVFTKTIGLTPSEFKVRFVWTPHLISLTLIDSS